MKIEIWRHAEHPSYFHFKLLGMGATSKAGINTSCFDFKKCCVL